MEKLQIISDKITKYGDSFLLFFDKLFLDIPKFELLNKYVYNFYKGFTETEIPIIIEDVDSHQFISNMGRLLNYVRHLILYGDEKKVGLDLTFFTNLNTLEAVKCKITSLKNRTDIEEVLCENSQVPLQFFENLRKVSFLNCPLTTIDLKTLPKKSLEYFSFCHSELRNLSTIFGKGKGNYEKLETIIFKRNKLVDIRSIENILNIKEVDFSQNRITGISEINKCKFIQKVSVERNFLSSVHLNVKTLKELNLSYNRIQNTNGVVKLTNLQNLNISHNKIVKIEEIKRLAKLIYLRKLSITGNECVVGKQSSEIVKKYFSFKECFILDGIKFTPIKNKKKFVHSKQSEFENKMKLSSVKKLESKVIKSIMRTKNKKEESNLPEGVFARVKSNIPIQEIDSPVYVPEMDEYNEIDEELKEKYHSERGVGLKKDFVRSQKFID